MRGPWRYPAPVFEACSTRTMTTSILSSTTASSRPARPGCASIRKRYTSVCMRVCSLYVYRTTCVYVPVCRHAVCSSVFCCSLEYSCTRGHSHTNLCWLGVRHIGCSSWHAAFPADTHLSPRPPLLPPTQECKWFVREHCREGSNPDYPWMQQIFTTLVTWRQLEQYLFPRLRTIWKSTPFRKAAPLDPDRNVFLQKVGLCV